MEHRITEIITSRLKYIPSSIELPEEYTWQYTTTFGPRRLTLSRSLKLYNDISTMLLAVARANGSLTVRLKVDGIQIVNAEIFKTSGPQTSNIPGPTNQ